MHVTELIAHYATLVIAGAGYPGLFFAMMLESMVFPLPSEAVMPFAGFLVHDGKFALPLVILSSTLGSIAGSLLSYFIGKYGGKPFIERFGRLLLLDQEDLDATQRFFTKHGQATIFFSRFIPVVRHLISIPAGMGRMNLLKFSIYTILGAGMWNAFLTLCGLHLRSRWDSVMHYSHYIDIAVAAVLVCGIIYFVKKHLQRRKKTSR